jgi:hypothetical protein
MPSTYEPIATTTLTSSGNVTFSSISGSYTDLVLVIYSITSSATDINIRLNGDSGTNYSTTHLTGNGSSAASFRSSNDTKMTIMYYSSTGTGSSPNVSLVQFMNYSNTTTNKTVISRSNNAANGVDANVHLFRSTSAITSMEIYGQSTNFSAGSTFTLYGIKAA